jgi:hypothetical protein
VGIARDTDFACDRDDSQIHQKMVEEMSDPNPPLLEEGVLSHSLLTHARKGSLLVVA